MSHRIYTTPRYSAPRFWYSLLSAGMLLPSAYWAASLALSGLRPHWFAVFSGCMFFAIVGLAVVVFRGAIQEWKKRSLPRP